MFVNSDFDSLSSIHSGRFTLTDTFPHRPCWWPLDWEGGPTFKTPPWVTPSVCLLSRYVENPLFLSSKQWVLYTVVNEPPSSSLGPYLLWRKKQRRVDGSINHTGPWPCVRGQSRWLRPPSQPSRSGLRLPRLFEPELNRLNLTSKVFFHNVELHGKKTEYLCYSRCKFSIRTTRGTPKVRIDNFFRRHNGSKVYKREIDRLYYVLSD